MMARQHFFLPFRFLRRRHTSGFTLIDLLIACVVLAILAAVAYPSYASHVRKAHRADAKTILLETAQYMERYHAMHSTYVGARVDAVSAVAPKNAEAARVKYHISFVDEPTAMRFTLQAAPVNGQEADNCGTLTVDQLGALTPRLQGCW